VAPETVFAVLSAPQQPQDVVVVEELRYWVDPETTRHLAEGYYLGVSLTGDACLITTREERDALVAEAGCATLTGAGNGVVLESDGPGVDDVALVVDGFEPPESWPAVGPNLLARGA